MKKVATIFALYSDFHPSTYGGGDQFHCGLASVYRRTRQTYYQQNI